MIRVLLCMVHLLVHLRNVLSSISFKGCVIVLIRLILISLVARAVDVIFLNHLFQIFQAPIVNVRSILYISNFKD